ncbi:hypothetical protein ABZU75_19170 [Streptosporangium sp. NPDC005286]|uniref:hypothetical protein n=1 Tax=Streptosporangium sp. NPDC005286 TaxID=3154463 RepID=UPI0033B392AE
MGFLSNLAVAAVPPKQTGVASGMNANIRTIGGSIGAAVMTTIVTAHSRPSGYPDERGYALGFATVAGIALLAALARILIPAAGTRRLRRDLKIGSGPEARGSEFYGPKGRGDMGGAPALQDLWAPLQRMDDARRLWP